MLSGLACEGARAGEYEVLDNSDCFQVVEPDSFKVTYRRQPLTPGISIAIAFVAGQYESISRRTCPRSDCWSTEFIAANSGGGARLVCQCCELQVIMKGLHVLISSAKCRIWFHFYKNSIFLRPYRGPSSIISANSQEREHPSSDDMYLARSLRQRRIDTPDFKYIKIAMVKLPNTPRKNFSAIAKKDFTPSRATRSWGGKYQDG